MPTRLGLVLGLAALGMAATACGSSGEAGAGVGVRLGTLHPLLTDPQGFPDGGGLSGFGHTTVMNAVSRNASAGRVGALSLYADLSGGVGILCLSVDANGPCNNVPVVLAAKAKSIASKILGQMKVPYAVTVASMPNGLDGPWTGDLSVAWKCKHANGTVCTDATAQTSIVQLVNLTGQETVGAYASANGSPWVDMEPSTGAPLCITDTDCTQYGLDTSNGAYTCANNTCVQGPAPLPCLPTSDQPCL